MKQVFVVTQGQYSDYHIEGVFSTEAKAENYISATGLTYCVKIKMWKVDADTEMTDRGLSYYWVEMNRTGDTKSIEKCSAGRPDWIWESGVYEMHMWAEDEEHAIKIANERRARIVALGQWKPGKVDVV